MKNKKVLVGMNHLENIKEGLQSVYDVVASTMGPGGANVLIEREYLAPIISKDGATVAEHLNIEGETSPIVNLVRNITRKAALESGDGTTTTTVLAYNIFKNAVDIINKNIEDQNVRVFKIKDNIQMLSDRVVSFLEENSKKVTNKEELKNIIMISTNQDKQMTDIIFDALDIKENENFDRVKDKEIFLHFSKVGKDYVEKVIGSRYECTIMTTAFCNNNGLTKMQYNDPLILTINEKIYNMGQIIEVLNYAKRKDKPLIIIAQDYDNDVVATLAVNKLQGTLKVAALKAPGTGFSDTEGYLSDIAFISGSKVLKSETEYSLDNFEPSFLGEKISFIDSDTTKTIFVTEIENDEINKRIDYLKEILNEDSNNEALSTIINRRIKKIKNDVSHIYIYADSDVEMFERKDRFEDAVGAIKSALEKGYHVGCGISLLNSLRKTDICDYKDNDDINLKIAKDILKLSLRSPFLKIMSNAEINIEDSFLDDKNIDESIGFDIDTGEKVNLLEKGIIDPTKVTICALKYSVSLASILISSKSSILVDKNDSVK